MIVGEVAPDRHGVAAAGQRGLNQFAIGPARARGGRPSGGCREDWRGGQVWQERPGVGGDPVGRICRREAPPPGRPHGEPGGFEVGAGGLAPHAPSPAGSAEASSPTAQVPELPVVCRRSRCWSCWREGPQPLPPSQRLERLPPMARFEVPIYGRFWVSTEVPGRPQSQETIRPEACYRAPSSRTGNLGQCRGNASCCAYGRGHQSTER